MTERGEEERCVSEGLCKIDDGGTHAIAEKHVYVFIITSG